MKEYKEANYDFKVHTKCIAEVKRELGLQMCDALNVVEKSKQSGKHLTAESVEAVKDALKQVDIISCKETRDGSGFYDAKFRE